MPEDLVRSFSKRTGQIDTELDRLATDGRERTPRLVKWTRRLAGCCRPEGVGALGSRFGWCRSRATDRGFLGCCAVAVAVANAAQALKQRCDVVTERPAGPGGGVGRSAGR
jgi:hypothetical protein